MCVLILLFMCPHTVMYADTSCCVCVLILVYVLILLYVSSYCYICVLTLLYVCPHTALYRWLPLGWFHPTLLYVCPHTTQLYALAVGRLHLSLEALCCMRGLILLCLLYMCTYTHAQVASSRAAVPESRSALSYATCCANCARARLVRLVGRRS
jgi:hypothetical protein